MLIFECPSCRATTQAEEKCSCNVAYVAIKPREVAARAVSEHPDWSNRKIADETGVDKDTVRSARKSSGENSPVEKRTGKDGRTRAMPKRSAGPNPKQRKNDPVKEVAAATLVLDQGYTYEEAATETGVGSVQIIKTATAREQGRREAAPARSDLAMTAQQKLDAVILQQKRALELEYEVRVLAEVRRRVEEDVLPAYRKDLVEAAAVLRSRKSIISLATFKKILTCLHPDRAAPELSKRYADAFTAFSALKLVLVGEAEEPTPQIDFPRTWVDLMARKKHMATARKAKFESANMARAG